MYNLNAYLTTYWQPLLGLVLGSVVIGLFFYLHLRLKSKIVQWTARVIFRNQFGSEMSAESLFKVLASFLFVFGALIVILALLYLHIL